MVDSNMRFHYDCLQLYNDNKYKERLTESHIISDKIALKVGEKYDKEKGEDVPDYHHFYILWKDRKKYALLASEKDKLPIIVNKSKELRQGKDVYELIQEFSSVKSQPAKVFTFRKLVDDLCGFTHSSPIDFTLWKICALSSVVSRTVFRVATEPAFGKDSVVTCLGELLGDTANLNKPTVAKLEFELTNKLILMNELGTLSGEQRQKMEDFLLNIGDMKNKYKKSSRAGKGTLEEYNIQYLSLILAFNNIDCYKQPDKYFDYVFNDAVYDRYIPFKFNGKITQRIAAPIYAKKLMEEYKPFYEDYIRSIMWYVDNFEEDSYKKGFNTEIPEKHKLTARWQRNFNTFIIFINLYAETQEEAESLIHALLTRHKAYLSMLKTPSEDSGLFVTQEKITL